MWMIFMHTKAQLANRAVVETVLAEAVALGAVGLLSWRSSLC